MKKRIQGLVAAAACVLCTGAFAQYKIVGADGKVTYSDRPASSTDKVVSQRKLNETAPAAATPLPFEVQQAASKYPVTLYTGDRCAPCDDARAYLRNRGVPFTEKTVTSDEDIALFKQQSPDGTAPVVAVGSRKAVGYAQSTWTALLDSAGYPANAQLPRDYQNPAPSALSPNTKTASQTVAQPGAGATRATSGAAAAAANAPTPPTAPPGFRF